MKSRHNRRTIQGTKHPTTPHDQPPNSITATRKLLTPYDTALIDYTTRPLLETGGFRPQRHSNYKEPVFM